jgi:penicillin-binding protein 1A
LNLQFTIDSFVVSIEAVLCIIFQNQKQFQTNKHYFMRNLLKKYLTDDTNPGYNKIIKWIWLLIGVGLLFGILVFTFLSFSDLPSVKDLENPRSEEASEVYAANEEVLGRYYTENRVPVKYLELSPNLVKALVATEDVRYYRHSGIDFRGLVRAVAYMGKKGGASTITQQLAKLLFTGEGSKNLTERLSQKLKEWIIAVRLERKYTKEEIIALYLNKFNFINGAYGIKAASEIYFGKSQADLNINEAAMLVGMLKNPSLFNPLQRAQRVLGRREVVLKQMQKSDIITQVTYDSLRQMPLGLNFTRQSHIDGLAPYFRSELAKDVKALLNKPENRRPDGTAYNIYKDGLKIYTTIDPDIQRIAEEEMVKNMKRVQNTFWKRWKKMDPWTFRSDSDHEISIERRKESLAMLIRTSDRYQMLRKKHLGDVLEELKKETDLVFHDDDREVERIIKENDKKGTISKLVSKGLISSGLAAQYREVLRSDLFTKLNTSWDILQEEVEEQFHKEVQMKVFAYNEQMEKDTVMSPFDSVKYHRMFLQTGILAVNPKNGHIKAWVGGIGHKYFKYDHTEINRQVGSTFKPFVYATAVAMQGFSPCYEVLDLPITIKPGDGDFFLNEEWTPSNSDGTYSGEVFTLKEGLRKSKNTVSVHLMKQLGSPEPVRELIDRMGISKHTKYPNGRFRVPKSPSICLGATDLSVMEMTGAYASFANNGYFNKPVYILKVEDKSGKVIYQNIPSGLPVMKESYNYVMVELLKYAGAMGDLKSESGGKTGTTNDYVDGWFMGMTPSLVVGTWVGGDDKWIRFRSLLYGQGGYMAKPFFRNFIKRLEAESDSLDYDVNARFYVPPGDLNIVMDCDEYKRDASPLDGEQPFEDEDTFDEDMFEDESGGGGGGN